MNVRFSDQNQLTNLVIMLSDLSENDNEFRILNENVYTDFLKPVRARCSSQHRHAAIVTSMTIDSAFIVIVMGYINISGYGVKI